MYVLFKDCNQFNFFYYLTGIKIEAGQDSTKNSKYSIDDILNQAEQSIEEYNYEMAQKFLERALEINSDHPRALEMTASLLLEVCNSLYLKKNWVAAGKVKRIVEKGV